MVDKRQREYHMGEIEYIVNAKDIQNFKNGKGMKFIREIVDFRKVKDEVKVRTYRDGIVMISFLGLTIIVPEDKFHHYDENFEVD